MTTCLWDPFQILGRLVFRGVCTLGNVLYINNKLCWTIGKVLLIKEHDVTKADS